MTNIFVYRVLPGVPYLPILYPEYGAWPRFKNHLFAEHTFDLYTDHFFRVTDDVASADFILLPHLYKKVSHAYVREAEQFAEQCGKPLIISAFGDSSWVRVRQETIVLRYSQYKHTLRDRDIIIPTYVPGNSLEGLHYPRPKNNVLPVVGFCGWAAYSGVSNALRSYVKNTWWELAAVIMRTNEFRARKKGVYFRIKSIRALQKSKLIETNFIIRKSFSSHVATARVTPDRARSEFIQNILESDLCLTVKGDGNVSTRLYEVLSLGRIPIIIDTDGVLPLESIIPYAEFCVVIPYQHVDQADAYIRKFYDSLTPEMFLQKQAQALHYFNTYLRGDQFYHYIFRDPETIYSLMRA